MSAGVKTQGFQKVVSSLGGRLHKARREGAVTRYVVGFRMPYAVYVHENLAAHHPVGQAKYLEQPMRENAAKYRAIVSEQLRKGKTLKQALYYGGLALLRDAQQLVPVDTGALKNSGYVQVQ